MIIDKSGFKEYKGIIELITDFDKSKKIKVTKSSISKLKGRKIIFRSVPQKK